jgi:NADPH-dependent 2,4-dienoyl-CoA reductase/sulfur reductase-like enzyme
VSKRYIIIGNGVAGISAIEEIRKFDKTGEILLFSKEAQPYYYRASLSEMITGKNTPAMLVGRTQDFYQQLQIKLIESIVIKIDPEQKIVYTQKKEFSYDELLIATGAQARQIEIPGDQHPIVYRNFSDTKNIIDALKTRKHILIIGGGVLGLELSAALAELPETKLAIVQRSNQIGRPILDEASSNWLIQRMEADGTTLFLQDGVEKIENNIAYLKSGRTWKCDLVVAAIGVVPVFPAIEGLNIGLGIQINSNGQTNLPHIYAAGDCTEIFDHSKKAWTPSRIWLEAAQQGSIAGANMAGIDHTYPASTPYNASYIYKDRYVIIGEPHQEGDELHCWQEGEAYRKILIINHKVVGALLINNRKSHLAIRDAINDEVSVSGDNLAQPAIDWNFIANRNWDYRFF